MVVVDCTAYSLRERDGGEERKRRNEVKNKKSAKEEEGLGENGE